MAQLVRAPPCHGGGRRFESDPGRYIACGILAQLGEHLPYKQGVTGSSPVGPICILEVFGWVPEWPKGADCKSVGSAFEGSNPSPSISTLSAHIAGWSSLVARRAHNPKVIGSNPFPATSPDSSVGRAED